MDIWIVGLARTAFGSFQGALSSIPVPQIGASAIQAALSRFCIAPSDVSEVILGNVLSAGVGQGPARQAALFSGIPKDVPAVTINKLCGSGMKSILLGVQSLLLGDSQVVVAGGMENMSRAPYLVPGQGSRSGFKMGHQSLLDSLILDGLWDPYSHQHMGLCAELCARERKISREEQDDYALLSFERAQEAQKKGKFEFEIAPVALSPHSSFCLDEGPSKVRYDKVRQLKPVFDPQGTITAANASTINDGAAIVVLASAEWASVRGVKPLAKIVSCVTHSQDPEWFTIAPIAAIQKGIQKAGWSFQDVDLFEVNEAFAVVPLAAQKELGIPKNRLNSWGGAISLGHPIGASGARIVGSLVAQLIDQDLKRGIASICIGGGEATAITVERV